MADHFSRYISYAQWVRSLTQLVSLFYEHAFKNFEVGLYNFGTIMSHYGVPTKV